MAHRRIAHTIIVVRAYQRPLHIPSVPEVEGVVKCCAGRARAQGERDASCVHRVEATTHAHGTSLQDFSHPHLGVHLGPSTPAQATPSPCFLAPSFGPHTYEDEHRDEEVEEDLDVIPARAAGDVHHLGGCVEATSLYKPAAGKTRACSCQLSDTLGGRCAAVPLCRMARCGIKAPSLLLFPQLVRLCSHASPTILCTDVSLMLQRCTMYSIGSYLQQKLLRSPNPTYPHTQTRVLHANSFVPRMSPAWHGSIPRVPVFTPPRFAAQPNETQQEQVWHGKD